MRYYESKLSPKQQKFYLKVVDAFRNRKKYVVAEKITDMDEYIQCLEAVMYDYPEFFYVDHLSYPYRAYAAGWEYYPKYLYNEEQTKEMNCRIDAIVRRIIQEIRNHNAISVFQKCWIFHSYLVRNCVYDYEAMKAEDKTDYMYAYTMEGVFLKGKAVCLGIAKAFSYLCEKCGVDAFIARGMSFEPGTTEEYGLHAWNIVRAGQEAAHFDVTWDMNMTGKDDPIRYDYFLLPDIDMMRDHQYVGYPSAKKSNSSYYDKMHLVINDISEIDDVVKRTINQVAQSTKISVQFKMNNRKEKREVVDERVWTLLRENMKQKYSAVGWCNPSQSVFAYVITPKV